MRKVVPGKKEHKAGDGQQHLFDCSVGPPHTTSRLGNIPLGPGTPPRPKGAIIDCFLLLFLSPWLTHSGHARTFYPAQKGFRTSESILQLGGKLNLKQELETRTEENEK